MTTMPSVQSKTADDRLLEELTARMERRDRWARRLDAALEWIGGTVYLAIMLLIWGAVVAMGVVILRWVIS